MSPVHYDVTSLQLARRKLLVRASAFLGVSLLPALSSCGGDSNDDSEPPLETATPIGPADDRASVSFESIAAAARLDSRFAGLSYEKDKLAQPLFTGDNTALINLFRLLGPSVLRIGARAVDRSSWKSAATSLTPILPEHIDALAAFVQATGWQVIYAVNMARNTPADAADEAAYVAGRLGPALLAWEIGNEPDLYVRINHRPAGWSYADYLKEWRELADAMEAASPGVPFSGPSTTFDVNRFTLAFAEDEASRLSMLTHHYYRANGEDASSTLGLLLRPDPDLPVELAKLVAAASKAGLKEGVRLDETNNFFNGGAPNVSNTYGTALWVMDFMFVCAAAGCRGVNVHGGNSGPGYTPISDRLGRVLEARPEFYGILMFSLGAQGLPLKGAVTEENGSGADLRAWGVRRDDGGLNAILINRQARRSVGIALTTGIAATVFDPLRLEAPELTAKTGQTLGGVAIADDGTWEPRSEAPLIAGDGLLQVTLPPASAVLLRSR